MQPILGLVVGGLWKVGHYCMWVFNGSVMIRWWGDIRCVTDPSPDFASYPTENPCSGTLLAFRMTAIHQSTPAPGMMWMQTPSFKGHSGRCKFDCILSVPFLLGPPHCADLGKSPVDNLNIVNSLKTHPTPTIWLCFTGMKLTYSGPPPPPWRKRGNA